MSFLFSLGWNYVFRIVLRNPGNCFPTRRHQFLVIFSLPHNQSQAQTPSRQSMPAAKPNIPGNKSPSNLAKIRVEHLESRLSFRDVAPHVNRRLRVGV